MNNNIMCVEKNKCFGCGSCTQMCPKDSISMLEDDEGFLYPLIDNNTCINCGLCIKACPSLIASSSCNFVQQYYAVKHKNRNKRLESSSGALFCALAEYILDNEGIVFGCVLDESLRAVHISVENKDMLEKIKGSKYIQSDTKRTFAEVANFLKLGRKVLYTGTPCQIAGLNAFLKNENRDNLFTADLICHGVPSYKLFKQYLLWLGRKKRGKITYYGFRDKKISGWSCGGKKIKIKVDEKERKLNVVTDPFYGSFLRGDLARPVCYTCKYSNYKSRPADITMGDFWGIEEEYPLFYSKDGVSVCLINSHKGNMIFEKIKNDLIFIDVSIDSIVKHNKNLDVAKKNSTRRNIIYNNIDNIPILMKCMNLSISVKIKRVLVSIIPFRMKVCLKKIKNKKGERICRKFQ